MTVQFINVDAEGAVAISSFKGIEVGFGMSACSIASIQTILAQVKSGEAVVVETLNFNAKPEQNNIKVMLGLEEFIEPFPAQPFQVYNAGAQTSLDEDLALYISEHDGYKLFGFGGLEEGREYTADECPEGGIGVLTIADEDWEQFVTDFLALVCVDEAA